MTVAPAKLKAPSGGVEPAAPAGRLQLRRRDGHRRLSPGALDRGDGTGVLLRPGLPDGTGGATAVSRRHRGGRNARVLGSPRAQWIWRSGALGDAELAHLHGAVVSQHHEVPAVARLSAHDIGPGPPCLGLLRSTGADADQSVGSVWTGSPVLLRASLLRGARRRGVPCLGQVWERRTGLRISSGAVNGRTSGAVSGGVR